MKILSSRLFKTVVSALLLATLALLYGPEKIVLSIRSADPKFLFYAFVAFIASGILGAFQWGILLRFHCIHTGFFGVLSRYFMGLFFNYVLPGFVGGDVMRIYQASALSGKATRAFSSTIADRIIGLLVLVMFSCCAFFLIPESPASAFFPVALIMFLALTSLIAIVAVKPVGIFLNRTIGRLLPENLRSKIAAVYHETHELTRSPLTLITVITTSFFIQLIRIGVHFLCARAVGIDLGFHYFALFVPIMEIIASIPISVGGLGVREGVGTALFSTVGIMRPDIVAYSLLAFVVGFIGSFPGGIAFAISGVKKKHS